MSLLCSLYVYNGQEEEEEAEEEKGECLIVRDLAVN